MKTDPLTESSSTESETADNNGVVSESPRVKTRLANGKKPHDYDI